MNGLWMELFGLFLDNGYVKGEGELFTEVLLVEKSDNWVVSK